ncbi:MAG: glycosyltransferase family 4 protein [Hyphomicrobiales bacterium]|nr:glycosyltransferase family 4 protein [Hyphomicrobiales bacterium]MCP5000758.1 glycosyltransferase family 4 protein [Hyphomicrobiales bacterium]
MHLVFVSSLLPVANPASGFDIANRVILDALRERGIKVSMLGYKSPGAELAEADGCVVLGEQEITTSRVATTTKLRWLATALTHRTTFSSAKMLACGTQAFLAGLADLAPFDGLVLNSVQLPGAFIREIGEYPTIFVAHNVEARSAAENAGNSTGAFERFLFAREARLIARLEETLCRQSRFVWTLSEDDRKTLAGDDDSRSSTLPLVTTMAAPDPLPRDRNIRYDIGLIGSWSWRPNRIGLEWFLTQIAGKLPPETSIAIAGDLAGLPTYNDHPGVRFLGRVADAGAFLRSCSVVPLASTAGTGVQLKAIEAFEAGLPCVATNIAVRGIGQVPPNCTVTDDPDAFARALVEKLQDAARGKSTEMDGCLFHARQKKMLLDAVGRGVNAI